MYEVHIRQKNPDDTSQIAGIIIPKQFDSMPQIRQFLKRVLQNLEVWIIDVETEEVKRVWKAGDAVE